MMRRMLALMATLALVGCADQASPSAEPPNDNTASAHEITLWHCGIEPTSFDGERWYVPDPPFDETNKGQSLEGMMTRVSDDEALFEADSGERVEFVPLVGEWDKPLCD